MSKTILYVQDCAFGVDLKTNDHLSKLKSQYPQKLSLHCQSTDDFFLSFDMKIDMAFVDADHYYASAMKDFENVLNHLSDDGVVFMHDTDPQEDSLINPGYCGDSYKLVEIMENRDDINIITLPLTEAGISIIMKKNSSRTWLRQHQ